MVPILILAVAFAGVNCKPGTLRDNFDYFNHGTNEDNMLKNLHQPKDERVLRPQEVKDWPQQPLNVGQITGVAINSLGQPVIFHRADRIWGDDTFNESNVYQYLDQGPITEDPILILDPNTGSVLHSWGANEFYMPHGLTIDHEDNVWVTDAAKHQVFKYTPNNYTHPALTIGEPFISGYSHRSRVLLCKPTSVAVATTGEIFVADGYCNNQVFKFHADGTLMLAFPTFSDTVTLNLPHSVTLLEHLDVICVADRENLRIVCQKAGLKSNVQMFEPATIIDDPRLGRVFAVASQGDTLYAINGPLEGIAMTGFTININTGTIVDTWEPSTGFTKTHAMAVAGDGSHLYVTEIGPNLLWKFELTDAYDKK